MKHIGIIRDDIFLRHIPAEGHPENPGRLEAVYAMLDQPDMVEQFSLIPPRRAEGREILLVHADRHLKKISATSGKDGCALTRDTFTSAYSYEAAMRAVGGLLEAVSEVIDGRLQAAFALTRPPGHHAEKSRAMGYCLFNNVALAAAFARRELGLRRVLIVDWDLHHGNGTQHLFENDGSVLYFSIHQRSLFPGTGLFTETGRGRGEGYTMNVPLPGGYGDAEYAAMFELLLRPVATSFSPELILVSAGFDTHHQDPFGGMRMTADGYAALTRSLMDMARTCCDGKLVFTLEGGYNTAALADSVKAVLEELADRSRHDPWQIMSGAVAKRVRYAVHRVSHVHGSLWKTLGESDA